MKDFLAFVCFVIVLLAFIGLIGTAGSLERDTITMTEAVKGFLIYAGIMVLFGLGLFGLERGEECRDS